MMIAFGIDGKKRYSHTNSRRSLLRNLTRAEDVFDSHSSLQMLALRLYGKCSNGRSVDVSIPRKQFIRYIVPDVASSLAARRCRGNTARSLFCL